MAAVTITTGTYHVYPGEVFTYTDDAFSLSANSASDNPGLAIDGSVTATGAGGVTGIWIGSTSFYNSTVIRAISPGAGRPTSPITAWWTSRRRTQPRA
jgi:hypothetical protein